MPPITFNDISSCTELVPRLSYEEVTKPITPGKIGYTDGTYFTRWDQGTVWIKFTRLGIETPKEAGWKFHIGVDDTDENNLRRAWDAIIPVLKEYQVAQFKVVIPGKKFSSTDAAQCGKQITIFCFNQANQTIPVLPNPYPQYLPKDYWGHLLMALTHRLINSNIKPAPFPPSDLPIMGSPYISYRNDSDNSGQYTSTSHHSKEDDPFKNIQVLAFNPLKIERPQFPVVSGLSYVPKLNAK